AAVLEPLDQRQREVPRRHIGGKLLRRETLDQGMAEHLVEEARIGLTVLVDAGEHPGDAVAQLLAAQRQRTRDQLLRGGWQDSQEKIGEDEPDGDVEDGAERHGSAPRSSRLCKQIEEDARLVVKGVVAASVVAACSVGPVAQEVGAIGNIAVYRRRVVLV